MPNNRKLNHSERGLSLFGSEKARDRADARRQIEGLGQQEQIVALLAEQNEMLRWMCERLHARDTVSRPD